MSVPSVTEKSPGLWGLWLFACVVVLAVTGGYWLFAWWRTPNADFGLTVLNSYGDTEMFPQIHALAHGQLGEFMTREDFGRGVVSVPVPSVALHVICVRLFGLGGYIVANVLAGGFFLMSLYFLLAPFSADRRWAVLLSAVVVSMVLQAPNDWFMSVGGLQGLQFWNLRIPRQLVTMTPFVLTLGFLLRIVLNYPTYSPIRWWIGLGITFAWLPQGDLYLGIAIGPAIAAAGIWMLLQGRTHARGVVVGAAVACLSLFVGLLPFVLQRMAEHPDLPRRLGTHPVALYVALRSLRGAPPVYLGVCLLVCGMTWHLRGRLSPQPGSRGVLITLLVFSISGYSSLLWFSQLFGRGIQIYHHPQAFYTVTSYIVLICALWVCAGLGTEGKRRTLAQIVLMVLSLAGSVLSLHWHDMKARNSVIRSHEAPGVPRASLEQVVHQLRTCDVYAHCEVLGTLDSELGAWWGIVREGQMLPGDSALMVREDREIERRFLAYCAMIGMSHDAFDRFLRTKGAAGMTCAKYQASSAYTYSSLDDYEDEERKLISATSIYDNWHLVIPRSERQRLLAMFDAIRSGGVFPRVDLLALRNNELNAQPDSSRFVKTFVNDEYTLWVDRRLVGQQGK